MKCNVDKVVCTRLIKPVLYAVESTLQTMAYDEFFDDGIFDQDL